MQPYRTDSAVANSGYTICLKFSRISTDYHLVRASQIVRASHMMLKAWQRKKSLQFAPNRKAVARKVKRRAAKR